ncbi:hypothetical protein BWI75_22935 [Gloeocapsopsis sp. AAB1 = 1H9]|uniref:Uncharacterized protein n=1 Tax=Gloeocapsopsis dulcis AAB1 = 1H9 TaxID=1433147 RepID=A0A6N8G5G0_9CHRO|nr:hypothetical protein [Gloeocapsopsis dulcis AAB1 = 1H9]
MREKNVLAPALPHNTVLALDDTPQLPKQIQPVIIILVVLRWVHSFVLPYLWFNCVTPALLNAGTNEQVALQLSAKASF